MPSRVILVVLSLAVLLFAAASAQDTEKVNKILEEIDPWVTTDTARIMSFIDSSDAITTSYIENSKYWESVHQDLSFLLGIDYLGNPQIDNTGRIYFMMRITGEAAALFYVDKPMSWPIQITPNNWTEEGFTIDRYAVHPSGDYILVTVNKHGDEMHDIWYFGRDGRFRPLLVDRKTRYSGIVFDEDNADQFYLFIDNRKEMHFGRYDIPSSTLDTIYTEPGAYYPADYHKGKLLFVRWKSFSETQLAMLDVASGQVTDLSDITLIWSAYFTPEGKVLAQTSAKSEEDEFMKICVLDPAKPKEFKVLYDPGKAIDAFMYLKKAAVGVVALNSNSYSELAGFDMKGQTVAMPKLDIGVLGGQYFDEVSGNDNGDVVLGFSTPTYPPTVFAFKLGDAAVTQVGKVSTFGFDFSDVTVDVIKYKSDDGTEIPALLYVPANAPRDGSNPAIIDFHGGPSGQSRPYFQRNLAFALSRGFVFMRPNVRGSTGYGPAYERADNLEGRWASLIDCERAIDYLINEGFSSPDRIAVWGASYGGYVVDWLVTHASDKIACGVTQVGVSDIDHTNRNSSQVFAKGWEKEYGPVGSDLTNKLSPIFYADDVTVPVLVTGGYNDPRVPPSDPRRFAYVLSKLGKQVWYYEEVEAGHGGNMKSQVIHDLASQYTFTMMHVMK